MLFTWTEDATEAQQHALAGELRKLPVHRDVVKNYVDPIVTGRFAVQYQI